jgi:hypothetical protein
LDGLPGPIAMTVGLRTGAIASQIPTNAPCTVQEDDGQDQTQRNPHCVERDAPRQGGDSFAHADEGNAQQHDPTDNSA